MAIIAVLYVRKQRHTLEAASIVIEGHSIDSLNIANLRRRVNRTFVLQESRDAVRIAGDDMEISWTYTGFCKAAREAAIEFSVDSEGGITFDKLNCVAFDLGNDPEMAHAIQPLRVGTRGISQKISVPFLKPLVANQPFSVLLKWKLPNCLEPGINYYTSTLSFAQNRVGRCEVRLIFVGTAPSWMRVYESTLQKPAALVKTLAPSHQGPGLCEYHDVVEDRPGRSARVYMFWRDAT